MLAEKKCAPCSGKTPPLGQDEQRRLLGELRAWEIAQTHRLVRTFKFPDFVSGLEWVNKVGALAEEQNHHPDIFLAWGKVRVEIWTHAIDNLSEADFVLAAKIDQIAPQA